MSMAAVANFYNKIESERLRLFGFSIQDCSIVKDRNMCTRKERFGCSWSKKSGGRCQPMILSDLTLLLNCYGPAENIFLRNCESLSKRQCNNINASAGCEWDDFTECSFSYDKFIADMQELSKRELDVTTAFSDATVRTITRLANQECPVAKDAESCMEIKGCLFDSGITGCIPRPAFVMRLATIHRNNSKFIDQCDLVDLVLTGECEGGTEDTCNKRRDGDQCFWDSDLELCMPSATVVFETMANRNETLLTDFITQEDRCKSERTQKSCELITIEEN